MRLIDADALNEALEVTQYNDIDDLTRTERLIDNAPTVDLWEIRQEATENALKKAEVLYKRPQGEWELIDNSGRLHRYSCSICGHQISCVPSCLQDYKGCYCGADMRGGAV